MIEPGVCFCPICGCSSREPFYAADVTEHAGWLRLSDQGYYLAAYDDPWQIYHLESPFAPDREDGMPTTILAYLDGESAPASELRRCCPHCFAGRGDANNNRRKTHFPPFIGRVPMYVVPMIGPKGSGKTAYLGALGSGALDPLALANYSFQAKLTRTNDVIQLSQRTTEIGGKTGNSNYIEIWERNSTEALPIALVLLLDLGGEHYNQFDLQDVFDNKPQPDNPVSRIMHGDHSDYPGIDGAFLISSAADFSGQDNTKGIVDGLESVLAKVPVACIYTCADKLINQEEKRPDRDRPPLLTRDSFPNAAHTPEHFSLLAKHFTIERIRERFALQEDISMRVKNHNYSHAVTHRLNCHGFVVRTCYPFEVEVNGKKEEHRDYTQQFNVADPIIWMLNRLHLFPMKYRGGNRP